MSLNCSSIRLVSDFANARDQQL